MSECGKGKSMIRILETTYKIEASRHEFDVLKKVLALAADNELLRQQLEEWECRVLADIALTLVTPPQTAE